MIIAGQVSQVVLVDSLYIMDEPTFDLLLLFTVMVNLTLLYVLKKRSGKGNGFRKWWVKEINDDERRERFGHLSSLFNFMTTTDDEEEEFFGYTRMSVSQFQTLLELVRPFLTKRSRRKPLSPELRLALTLSYLSQGNSVNNQAWNYLVGRSTAYKIVIETCKAISRALTPTCLPRMTPEKWSEVAKGFMEEWQFPNCLGAIDGKHIRIKAPPKSGSEFYNYKGNYNYFSLVLMATCDAKYRFTWVDIGQYGSISDGGVWNNTAFAANLQNNLVNLPPPKRLPGSNISTNHAFVGDEAFPLREYLLRPYSRLDLGDAERIFNYRLSRARRTIENAFGILTNRWLIFQKPIGHHPDNCMEIVRATICLHNFIMSSEAEIPPEERVYCPPGFVEAHGEARLDDLAGLGPNNPTRRASAQRDILKNYFLSEVGESQAPWQYAMAFQGLSINVPH